MANVHLLAANLELSASWGLVLVSSSATLDRKRVWQGRERERERQLKREWIKCNQAGEDLIWIIPGEG